MKVAVTTTSFGKYDKEPLNLLAKSGVEIILNPYHRKLKGDEIIELCKEAAGIVAGTEIIDINILKKLNKLKVISRCGAGIDNIDMDTVKRLGIKVYNTPDAPTLAVAELTIGLILSLLRKVVRMNIAVKDGRWEKLMGNLLYGKKVGIIGFGRIGKKVAELLRPFGCEIKYYDIRINDSGQKSENLGTRIPLSELLKTSDIITLHVSSNERILGEDEMWLIKSGAWLINVSRSGNADEKSLYQLLKNGRLSGAAIDVFEQEPYVGLLRELDNVILTPHIGSYAKESRVKMEIEAAENLLKGLGCQR